MKIPSLATTARTLSVGALMLLSGCKAELLNPQGAIGMQEKHLMLTALWLMLIVVIPAVVWDADQRGLHDKAAAMPGLRAPALAWRITGAPTSSAAAITACTCSRLLTLKAGMP